MQALLTFLFSFFSGYFASLFISHPQRKRIPLPRVKIKNLELMPNLRLHFKNSTYHIHHWVYLSVLAISSFLIYEGFQHLVILKGVTIGSIVQGLRYKDRFQIKKPRLD